MYKTIFFITLVFSIETSIAQEIRIRGNLKDATTAAAIPEVVIRILKTDLRTLSNANGSFVLEGKLPEGDQTLVFSKQGYLELRLPVMLHTDQDLYLEYIPLEVDLAEANQNLTLISLSDMQLNGDEAERDNVVSGLLGATNDVFSNAAAFDFSATFFRPRGLDSKYSRVLINGIELNKFNTGRPQWSNWGGLNDVMRNREFSQGITANDYTFGGPAGTLHFNMQASTYRRGGRISYAYANRTYTGRAMASYTSGVTQSNWAYSVLASRRFGQQGYVDGTLYDANSLFIGIEKILSEQHSLNLSVLYTPNRRGRGTALTQELIDLKGNRYNPNWGFQNGNLRNARLREIQEPVAILTHNWKLHKESTLTSSLAYQWGKTTNSRIDYTGSTDVINSNGQESFSGGSRNPAPNYYQNLPSYFLRFETPTAAHYQQAYLAQEEFTAKGQLDWNALYEANQTAAATGLNTIYAVQNDVNRDRLIQASSILNTRFSEHLDLDARIGISQLKSENYAELDDLLGGSVWLDIDSFAEDDNTTGGDLAQSDLQHRNRLVTAGDRYKYNYSINAFKASAFAQLQGTYNHFDYYTALQIAQTNYHREGLYENGYYPGAQSLGKSEAADFTTLDTKGGFTYKFNGKHFAQFNAGVLAQPPTTNTVFTNARQNNAVIKNPSAENILSLDASYIYRSASLKARLTGYYLNFTNGSEVSYFYTQSLQNPAIENGNALVQEITTGISRQNIGFELGAELKVLPTLSFKAAAAVSQNTYTDNPKVYYTTTLTDEPLVFGDGRVKLKNYHVSGGPEQALQIGFDYRDPDFWWLGGSLNRFANAYVDVSYLRRSAAFSSDYDGLPLTDYNPEIAKQLLQQEQLDSYYLINLVGGKSWRIKDYTLGFFALVNNLLNTRYKTGGFEDSRIGDYRSLQEEQNRGTPLFGNRYFLGYGTTVYANFYIRF